MVFKYFQGNGTIQDQNVDIVASRVPPGVVAMWQELGEGFIGREGFVRLLDPVWIWKGIADSVTRPADITPIFVTGLGDVIVFRPNLFVPGPPQFDAIFFRFGTYVPLSTNSVDSFFQMLEDPAYLRDELHSAQYSEAIQRTGVPRMNECLTHTPYLALGGPDSAETLRLGGVAEFWKLRTDLVGPVQMWTDAQWRAIEEAQEAGRNLARAELPGMLEDMRQRGLIPPDDQR